MKLLNLSQYYYPIISNGCFFGGGEEVTYKIHKILESQGIDITSATTKDCDKFSDKIVFYNSYSKNYIKKNVNKGLVYFTLRKDFFDEINFEDYDTFLVHANFSTLKFLNNILKNSKGKLVIAYIHSNPYKTELTGLRLLKEKYPNLKISVLSENIKDYVNNFVNGLVDIVIGNFFVVPEIGKYNTDLLLKDSYYVYIGRFDKSKNYEFLTKFRKKGKNVLFITKAEDRVFLSENGIKCYENPDESSLLSFLETNKDRLKLIVPGIEAFSNVAFKCQCIGIPVFYLKHPKVPDSLCSYIQDGITGKGFDLVKNVEIDIIKEAESGNYNTSKISEVFLSRNIEEYKKDLVNKLSLIYSSFYGK